MATSLNSTEANLNQLTSFVEGFRARTLALLDSERELDQGREVDSTLTCSDSLASYDPGSCSWRTSQGCLFPQLQMNPHQLVEFLGIWPRSGLMRSGECFQRMSLELGTSEKGSLSLPTPQALDERFLLSTFGSTQRNPIRNPGIGKRFWCHPAFSEWLMGFPLGWTDLKRAETQSSHK